MHLITLVLGLDLSLSVGSMSRTRSGSASNCLSKFAEKQSEAQLILAMAKINLLLYTDAGSRDWQCFVTVAGRWAVFDVKLAYIVFLGLCGLNRIPFVW